MHKLVSIILVVGLLSCSSAFAKSGFTMPPVDSNAGSARQNHFDDSSAPAKKTFKLSITPSKTSYNLGDFMSLKVTASRSCYLSLIDFGTSGAANLLFPNAYQVNNYLKAGEQLTIPNNRFDIRIGGATGKERILGICTLKDTPLFKQAYDFKRHIFISLGKASDISGLTEIAAEFDKNYEARMQTIITITH